MRSNKWLGLMLMGYSLVPLAESLKPPHPLTTPVLVERIVGQTLNLSHYRIIGACAWGFEKPLPHVITAPAIEQFLPDLIVTVSNRPDTNPWLEARTLTANSAANTAYQALAEQALGFSLDFGDTSNQISPMHGFEERTRTVAVMGSPLSVYQLPKVTHRPETKAGFPYYFSAADAVMDRTGIAEMVYMATHPELVNHAIGQGLHVWGMAVPRLMRVTQPSRFRASVVAALHAADIVTNRNPLHVTHSTANSCGDNCVVANVIDEAKAEHVIWQEIYPINRIIRPGAANDFGLQDDKAGNGNYVFALWRHYRGCVKQDGQLIHHLSYPDVGLPIKR